MGVADDVPRGSVNAIMIEDLIRREGSMSIEKVMGLLKLSRSSVAIAIKESETLVVEDGIVRLADIVQSEYGEVTVKELSKLRKYKWPTPEEIKRRSECIRGKKKLFGAEIDLD